VRPLFPEQIKKARKNDPQKADYALEQIQLLYAVEQIAHEECFASAQRLRILDFYHAKEKLVLFARHQWLCDEQRRNWVKEQSDKLLNNELEEVLCCIRSCRSETKQRKWLKLSSSNTISSMMIACSTDYDESNDKAHVPPHIQYIVLGFLSIDCFHQYSIGIKERFPIISFSHPK